jgi:hypothetical protein
MLTILTKYAWSRFFIWNEISALSLSVDAKSAYLLMEGSQ